MCVGGGHTFFFMRERLKLVQRLQRTDLKEKNLVLINRWNGPRYQHVLVLCAFLTEAIPKGLILRKFCLMFVCFFVLCGFVSGLILWFLDNLWFDDLHAE